MTKHAALTDKTIRATKQGALNPRRGTPLTQLTDGRGLYLKLFWDRPAHSWRFDFKRPDGQRDTLVLGSYEHTGTPSMPLGLARERAAELRATLARGIDPRTEQATARAAVKTSQDARERVRQGLAPLGSFQHVAELFLESKARIGAWGASYADRFKRDLRLRVYPAVGMRPVAELTTADFLTMAEAMIDKGDHPGAMRALNASEAVLGYGILKRFVTSNAVAALGKLSDVIGTNPKRIKHHAAVTTPQGLRRVMQLLDGEKYLNLQRASWVQAQTFQRPRNVSAMRWCDVDMDAATWTIPSALMKRRVQHKLHGAPHLVPLARQTVALLREQFKLSGGETYVFPHRSDAGKPMARNALNECFGRLGIGLDEHTPHGFRATARTMCREVLGIEADVLEAHLAHTTGGETTEELGDTYSRVTFVPQRALAVQAWADYLDHVVHGAPMPALQVVPTLAPVPAVAPLQRAA